MRLTGKIMAFLSFGALRAIVMSFLIRIFLPLINYVVLAECVKACYTINYVTNTNVVLIYIPLTYTAVIDFRSR